MCNIESEQVIRGSQYEEIRREVLERPVKERLEQEEVFFDLKLYYEEYEED